MGFEVRKTGHSGAKKGKGAYWGQKVDAKKESNRIQREDDKKAALGEEVVGVEGAAQ